MATLEVTKGSLDYEVHGPDGAPWAMVLPGAATSRWMYEPLRDALAAEFRVATFDYRGIGRSRNDLWHVTPQVLAEDSLTLLRHLGAERAHLASISLGCFVMSEMLHREPGRVGRCAIGAMPVLRDRWVLPEEAQVLMGGDPDGIENVDELKPVIIPMFFSKPFRERQRERFEATVRRVSAQSTWEVFAGIQQFWGGFGYDWGRTRVFDRLAPGQRLFLTGEADFLARPEDVRDHPLTSKGPTVVFREAGHVFFWEQPEAYNAVVRHFFRTGRAPDPLPEGAAQLAEVAA